MTHEEILGEFIRRAARKQTSLDMTHCPWNEDMQQGYKSGWADAWMWAREILTDIIG